jgi:hypothetical protein
MNEINLLANELADAIREAAVDFEYETMLDTMFAEHQAMLYAAQSYDLDAQAYGEM